MKSVHRRGPSRRIENSYTRVGVLYYPSRFQRTPSLHAGQTIGGHVQEITVCLVSYTMYIGRYNLNGRNDSFKGKTAEHRRSYDVRFTR